MAAKWFTVKTDDGYVGRSSLSAPLTGNQPAAFAYTYDERADAERVAAEFNGVVEESR